MIRGILRRQFPRRSHWRPFPYPKVADRKVCTCGDAVQAGEFCKACLARVPAALQRELDFCERMMKGSDRWTAAVAQVEQWLRGNPK